MVKDKKQFTLVAIVLVVVLIYSFFKERSANEEKAAAVNAMISAQTVEASYYNDYPGTETFIDGEAADNTRCILFTVHQQINTFKYLSVEVENDGMNGLNCISSEELYSCGPLASEETVLIQMQECEIYPDRAIELTDKDDTLHAYYITFSGKDGAVILEEFQR